MGGGKGRATRGPLGPGRCAEVAIGGGGGGVEARGG